MGSAYRAKVATRSCIILGSWSDHPRMEVKFQWFAVLGACSYLPFSGRRLLLAALQVVLFFELYACRSYSVFVNVAQSMLWLCTAFPQRIGA